MNARMLMKLTFHLGGSVLLLLSVVNRADAHNYTGSTNSDTVSCRVLSAISITESGTQKMNFGLFLPDLTRADFITISPAGVRSTTSGYVKLLGSGYSADQFTVSGDTNNPTYSITLPASSVTITYSTYSMTVDTFTSTPSGSGTMSSGSQTITVGARLSVGANQHAGAYTGSYTITVAYQ